MDGLMPAPQATSSLNPIAFKDFSPGIADLPGTNYKSETATRKNTYRCIANHSGALVPLPWRQNPFPLPTPNTQPPTWVTGLYLPPIGLLPKDATSNFTANMYPEHQLFVGIEWRDTNANAINHNLLRYRRFEAPLGTGYDTIKTTSNPFPAANIYHPNGMNFATTRSNRADYSKPGPPVVIIQGYGYLSEFPDDQNPASLTPYNIASGWYPTPGSRFILHMTTHQGRVVLQEVAVNDHGPNTITFVGENTTWSFFNNVDPAKWGTWNGGDPTVPANFDTTAKVFVPENPSGFAVMVSMSANELFCVKGARGGMYVTGSLDVGTVVSLPMVTGAEISQMATVTPIGVVYGNRNSGVWVWNHGDNSTLISPQMIPNFWVTDDTVDLDTFGGISYSLSSCDDWVLTPNNFLYDTQLKSWWRLEDPAIYTYRWVSSQWHFIYTAAQSYTNTDPNPIGFFKREWKSPTYSWQSQPIWQSVEDIVSVNDIGLIAEGNGEVRLTLTALDGQTRSIIIPLSNCGYPERFRERLAIQGKYLQLRIEASSPNAYFPAPTVYSVSLYPFSEAPIGHTQ